MSLLQKLNLLLLANKIVKDKNVMKLWEKVSGYKSLLGLLGIVLYYGLKQFGVNLPDVVLEGAYGLLGVGLVHKLDKATSIVTKVIEALGSVLKLMEKKKEENKDEPK